MEVSKTLLDAVKGKKSAMRQLYAENKQTALYAATLVLEDDALAVEATLDAFAKAWDTITGKYDPEKQSFQEVLAGKLAQVCLSAQAAEEPDELPLHELGVNARLAAALYYLYGMSDRELASAMRLSEREAKAALDRAFLHLKRSSEDEDKPDFAEFGAYLRAEAEKQDVPKSMDEAANQALPAGDVTAHQRDRNAVFAIVFAALLLVAAVVIVFLLLNSGKDEPADDPTVSQETTVEPTDATDPTDTTDEVFDYSAGIDENGFWEGIRALDYVTLCNYEGISVPADTHTITDEQVDAKINTDYLASLATQEQVTDRAVADGDSLNIDFVGSVDGVEFEGGSTNGAGTDVTIGVTSFIDDFLEQLIGHMPGETFDIEVTFPDPYSNNPDLAGKDAVFSVTINHITETVYPELTDAFVSETYSESNGWTTVEEMRTAIAAGLQETAVANFVLDYITTNTVVNETPKVILDYQNNYMIDYYSYYASRYGVDLETFLVNYVGVETREDLIAMFAEDNTKQANYFLILQAIAENAGIAVTAEDLPAYFMEQFGSEDYTSYEENYGMNYLLQTVLTEKVVHYVIEKAVLE